MNKSISQAKTTTDKNYTIEQKITRQILILEITGEETGYTIQALKGVEYWISDSAVVVKTYKVNIVLAKINNQNEILTREHKGSFNVTRDSWYYLGTKNDAIKNMMSEAYLLNREFVPDNYSKNRYTAQWIPNFPMARTQDISRHIFDDGLNAFRLTRFGSKELPAKPLRTQKDLKGNLIESARKNNNIAEDVLIHVGGTYSVLSYEHLGGSFGCFGFIPEKNIHKTVEEAKLASKNDDYDDYLSNSDWKKVCQDILNISFPTKMKIEIHLKEKKGGTYVPDEILEE